MGEPQDNKQWEGAMGRATPDRTLSGASLLSVSVFDAARGHAAEGVLCHIERQVDGDWQTVASGTSDQSGTFSIDNPVMPGVYRVGLDSDPYFATIGTIALLPKITTIFRITDECHITLHSFIDVSSLFTALIRNE
jgi:5-hydroxyisourate hydrolase-like protein (transthyretin family)